MGKKQYEEPRICYICNEKATEKHHVFTGNGRREKSDKYDMTIDLCCKHHNGSRNSVHQNYMMGLKMKCIFQRFFKVTHPKEDFIEVFGKDYIATAKMLGRENPMMKEFKDLEVEPRKKNPWIQEGK